MLSDLYIAKSKVERLRKQLRDCGTGRPIFWRVIDCKWQEVDGFGGKGLLKQIIDLDRQIEEYSFKAGY